MTVPRHTKTNRRAGRIRVMVDSKSGEPRFAARIAFGLEPSTAFVRAEEIAMFRSPR
jgi:hypothetical protein